MGNFAEKKACSRTCHMMKKCGKESGKENKDCSSNACNPFMPCAIGNFFLNETTYHQNDAVTILSLENIIRNEKIISSYTAYCWHPPKSSFS